MELAKSQIHMVVVTRAAIRVPGRELAHPLIRAVSSRHPISAILANLCPYISTTHPHILVRETYSNDTQGYC
jgi:hypothetical protein